LDTPDSEMNKAAGSGEAAGDLDIEPIGSHSMDDP